MLRFGIGAKRIIIKPPVGKLIGISLFGGTFGSQLLLTRPKNLIYNDAGIVRQSPKIFRDKITFSDREERKKKYKDMCYGSIFGLVSGIIMGKISSVLVYVSVFTGLLVEWLGNRGYVNKDYISRDISRWMQKFVGKNFNLERPFFKLSFLVSFVIAAVNI